jgi:flagellar basal body-associated protein FliL
MDIAPINNANKDLALIIFAIIIVVGVVPLLIAPFMFGATFGQRCGAVYDGAAKELCINRLVNGEPLYIENIGKMKTK